MKIDFEATAKKYGIKYEKPKKKTGKIDFEATAKKYGINTGTQTAKSDRSVQSGSLLARTMNDPYKPDVTVMSYEDLKRSALGDLGVSARDTSTPLSRFNDAVASGKVLATIGDTENASRTFGAYDELYSRLRQGAYDEGRQQYRLSDSQKKTVETAISRLQKEFGEASGNYKNLAREYEDLFRSMTERGSYAEVAGLSLAAGGASSVRDTAAGISNMLTDAVSGGRRTEAYQKLDDYFGKNPSALYSAVKGDPIFTPAIAAETGVRQEDLDAYIETMTTQASRDMIYEDAGRNLNRNAAEFVGNAAFDIGRQIPGMMLTAGMPAAESRGLIGSLIDGQGASQALASALRGNLATYLTGAASMANAYSEGMHQGDYKWQNFVNAFGQGFVEYFTEGLFGFSDTASYKAIFENPVGTGSTRVVKSVLNWLLTGGEEALEEVVNVPLSNIVGLATGQNPELTYALGEGSDPYLLNRTTAAKKLFGENGVFNLDEMVQGGVQGFAVGALMGMSGAVSSTYESFMEGRDIASTITELNRISRQELPVNFRPQELNPAAARQEDVDAYVVQLQNAIADYAEQVRDGAVSLQVKPRAAEAPTAEGEPATYARDYNLRFRQTDAGLELQEVRESPNAIRRSNQMNRDGNMLLEAAYRAYQEANPESTVTPDEYASEFEIAYEYGRSGADLDTTRQSTALRNLSAATIEAAHSAGRQAVQEALQVTETTEQAEVPDIESVKIRNVPKTVRDQIVRDYTESGDETDAAEYAGAAAMAYNYGEAGLRMEDVSTANEGASTDLIRKYYEMGVSARAEGTRQAKLKNASFRAANPNGVRGVVRSITAEEGAKYGVNTITRKTFNKRQRAAIQVARMLSDDLGINIVLYESRVGKGGVREGDNGFYRDRTLYLDIEAGYNNEQAMLRTLSHELTHYLEDAAPEQYESLSRFVTDYFYESGDLSDLVAREQQIASQYGETMSEKQAMLEVVANACETMLRDTEAMRAMLRHNTSLFRTIRGWIDDFAKAVRRAFQGIEAHEEAAKLLERSEKALREASRLWYEALSESAVGSSIMSAKGAEATLEAAGIQFDADSGSILMRSRRSAPQTEEEVIKTVDAIVKTLGVSRADAMRWVESETTLAATILSLQDENLDYEPDALYDAIKSNADYPQGTVDFSNLCRKRREFTAYFDRLQKNFPQHIFTAEEIETIRQVMIRRNIEVACGLCFVEERRQQLGKIASDFIDGLKNGGLKPAVEKKLDRSDSYIPTLDELITYEGLSKLRETHPALAEAFVAHNNARGMQAGRLIEGAAEYKREVLKWNKKTVDRKNSLGGLRIFSFSDFEAPHLIDIVQIIQDCAVKGVKMQGYTKVPAFAKAVRNTGLKVNRSHIALGSGVETRDGKRVLVNDPVEGIDFNDPDFFDSSDSPNIGNNVVGMSDEHIRLAMADPYFDQVIPFHTSLPKAILTQKKIDHWKNYKNYQTEKIAEGFDADDSKTWKRAETGVNFYTDVLDAAEREGNPIRNKVEFVERFLGVCKERGVIPRFWNFLDTDSDGNFVYTEGYHKLLVDYKLFDRDGNILPQEVVRPEFDDEYNTRILEDYAKGYQKPGADDSVYGELVQELGLEEEVVRRSRREVHPENVTPATQDESLSMDATDARNLARYQQDLQQSVDGTLPSNRLVLLGKPSEILQRYMKSENPIYIPQSVIRKATNTKEKGGKHGLGIAVLEELPFQFADPMAITGNTSRHVDFNDNSVVVWTDWKTVAGDSIIVPIRIDANGTVGVYNNVNSVFDAYDAAYVADLLREGNVIYTRENKNIQDLLAQRRDMPKWKIPDVSEDTISQEDSGVKGHSRRDPYAVSDREVLANAYEYVSVNAAEDDALKRYRKNIDKLEDLEQQLETINDRLRQQFVAGGERLSRAEVSKLSENKKTLQNQIARQDRVLLNFERSAALKRVLEVAKKTAVDRVKAKAREDARAYRERIRQERAAGAQNLREYKSKTREARKVAEYKARVMDLTKELTSWIVKPDNKRHVPTMLLEPVGKFLESIDLSSKALLAGKSVTQRDSRFRQALYALEKTVAGEGEHKNDVFMLDISPELSDYLEALQGAAEQIAERESGVFVVEQMTGDQLEMLYKVLRELRRVVTAANQTLTLSQYETVDQLARETMQELDRMGKKHDQADPVRAVDNFFRWDNTTPVYAFDRFGKPGQALFGTLQDAQSKLAFDADEVIRFAEETYTAKEVRDWQKETHEIRRGGETVTVTTAQLMELYNLMRRDQGRSHIEGGSVKFAEYQGRRNVSVTDDGGAMSYDEVEAALQLLTKRQIEVAEKLQEYATKTGGEWGNQISMRRFGIRSFTEERYWPIRTDKNVLNTAIDAEGNELYRLLNKSFTKPTTQNANNQIVVGNVFDTFAAHMSDMAQYHSFALPVLDMLRWINYTESTTNENGQRVDHNVKQSMDAAFGKAAQQYVLKLLKDINGNKTTGNQMGMAALSRYNRAAVGANLRVAMLQPTAIARAQLVEPGLRLARGVTMPHFRRGRGEMLKWSGIAKWKDMGFFEVNVSRNLSGLVKQEKTAMDRIVDSSMKLAEKADRMTWVAMWNACRSEVMKEGKLKEESDEFFREVAKRFENVVYRTQVVDSVLTKSDFMRRDDFVSRSAASFMSEPVLTYNTLLSVRNRLSDDARKYGKGESWRRNRKYAMRALYTYAVSQALSSAVQAVSSAMRDDDEYKTFEEKYRDEFIDALKDNFNLMGNLPILSQLLDVVKSIAAAAGVDTFGYDQYSGMFEWSKDVVRAAELIKERADGTGKYTDYGIAYKLLSGVSALVGLPLSGATREVVSAYNLVAQIYNEYIGVTTGKRMELIRQYDAGAKNRVKYAYQDGYLTEEEAISALQEDAGLSEEDAAGEVNSWDKKAVREAFNSGELSGDELAEALEEQAGLSEDDAYWTAQEWQGGETYKKYDEFYAAVEKGTNLKTVVNTYLDHGVTKKTLAGQITEYFKPRFIELYSKNRSDATSLMGYLLNAYELLGYDREKKRKDILAWLKQDKK